MNKLIEKSWPKTMCSFVSGGSSPYASPTLLLCCSFVVIRVTLVWGGISTLYLSYVAAMLFVVILVSLV